MNRLGVPNEMLCVHAGIDGARGRITDRACCLMHWGEWLSIETDYSRAVGELRRQGRKVVQVSHMKCTGNAALLREIMRQVFLKAVELSATDIVAAVPPEFERPYRSWLHFNGELFSDFQVALIAKARAGEAEGRYGAPEVKLPTGRWILARDLSGGYLPVRVLRLDLTMIGAEVIENFLRGGVE